MKRSSNGKFVSSCKGTQRLLYTAIFICLFSACSVSKQIGRQATTILLQDSTISSGHTGISIYEPASNRYWYNYNDSKYFIPASNTKLFTLYAGMKYLGDSLVGLRYTENNIVNPDTTPITDLVKVFPTGDPTFLSAEFSHQPVFEFLKKQKRFEVCDFHHIESYGKGWAWDDYMEGFMIPRSSFPIYKNILSIKFIRRDSLVIQPAYFKKQLFLLSAFDTGFAVSKDFFSNKMSLVAGKDQWRKIPFYDEPVTELLKDTLKNPAVWSSPCLVNSEDINRKYKIIHSQPTDSLLKPMMHNSDNFFAEQTLLMASNEHLGYMDDAAMIDTLLQSDFNDIPQQPRWVDGSGLSRYNLFTPQSFIYILKKLQFEFGMQRLKVILPTGGQGTLKNYFNSDSSFIYAKTGSMSNQFTLCGYLTTKKNKQLIFSVMINNAKGSAVGLRRSTEHFIKFIRDNY